MIAETRDIAPLDLHFARFVERMAGGPDPVLHQAALLACAATRAGHSCLDLGGGNLPGELLEALPQGSPLPDPETLRKSPAVGAPGDFLPLILDSRGRLYLHRYHACEETILRGVRERSGPGRLIKDEKALSSGLSRLFTPAGNGGPDYQKTAAALALLKPFAVISGGPGTGKTHTAAAILALVLEQNPEARIALAAPTGKAAARLTEAVGVRAASLGLPRVPGTAMTLHRLLGAGRNGFSRGPENPVSCDFCLVDEASMVDLRLMAALFSALPPSATLVLLGDRNQLASVDPGAVLGDLCQGPDMNAKSPEFAALLEKVSGQAMPRVPGAPPIQDLVAELKKTHRFSPDSGIAALARAVVSGDPDRVLTALNPGGEVRHVSTDDPAAATAFVRDWFVERYRDVVAATNPEEALDRFARFRVLAAHRNGPGGVHPVNRFLTRALWKSGLVPAAPGPWFTGRPVLVTQNDPRLNLFNGDVGMAWEGRVYFRDPAGRVRDFPPGILPENETAFAMTVHKSQGQEYDEVLVLLPPEPSRVTTRELLYTAVTRARKQLTLTGPRNVAVKATQTPTTRISGLGAALWENG